MSYRTTFALLLTLVSASVASAQTDAKPGDSTIMNNTLQVTGTVVASEANRLVVKTDKGQEMVFIITDKQVDASLFHAGDRVTASYTTLAGTGAVVSKVIMATAPVTTTTTQYTPPVAEVEVKTTPAPAPAPAMATTTTTTRTVVPAAPAVAVNDSTPSQAATTLPETASPMPLFALLGLIGAGGAATIRRFRLS